MRKQLWIAMILVYFLALGFALAGDNYKQDTQKVGYTNAQQVDLDDIADHPDKFFGKTVTFKGKVDEVFNPRAFTVTQGILGDEILVVIPALTTAELGKPDILKVQKDLKVTVTGAVTRFNRAEVEKKFNMTEGEELDAKFKDRPAVIATSVRGGDEEVELVLQGHKH